MRKPRQTPLRIGAFFNRKTKASREQVAGIFRFAGEHPDWELHLFTRPDSPDELQAVISSFVPDGVITGHPAVLAAFRKRLRRRIPGVLIDFAAPHAEKPDAFVCCDDHEIGETAARTFLNRGFRHFAFAGIEGEAGDSDAANSRNRENGFRRALRTTGVDYASYHERLLQNAWRYADARGLLDWLVHLPKPCALLAHSDILAKSILECCRKARIDIPGQIAVIGVDNETSVCENTSPTLSSIEPDFAGGGYRGAELLDLALRRKRGNRTPCRATYGILRTVERMSTQNVTGTHLRIAKAKEIIRSRAFAGLRTPDIASQLGISPRMLEILFLQTCGHTLRDEILRTRLEEVRRLLRETSLPFDKVAIASGFRTLAALKSIFRRRFGCSMRTFRTRQAP